MGGSMDKHLVGTQEQVAHDLAIINDVAAAWWSAQGYTVVQTEGGKAVVGKNAATGEDNAEALTTTWAEAAPVDYTTDEESGEIMPSAGTLWWIPSPSGDQRFYLWRDYLPEGAGIRCEEVSPSAKAL